MGFFVSTVSFALVMLALIGAIEVGWRRIGRPRGWPHEVGRKAHHIGIGLMATLGPVWLPAWWVGFLYALSFGGLLLVFYRYGGLSSLFSTERAETAGGVWRSRRHSWIGPATFSLAVAVLCLFFWDTLAVYTASMLALCLADAAATVAGLTVGRRFYTILGTRRSLEGNLALWLVATLVAVATLGAASPVTLAVSALLGLLIALTETISPLGLDNITVPMMTAVVLISLMDPARTHFVLGGDLVGALALVTATALAFTVAHLSTRWFDAAALLLGASSIILLDMERYLFVTILLVFLAYALGAQWLAAREGRPEIAWRLETGDRRSGRTTPSLQTLDPGLQTPTARPVDVPEVTGIGVRIVAQAGPCLAFILAGRTVAPSGLAVGSLACLTLLGRHFWASLLWGPPGTVSTAGRPHPSLSGRLVEALVGTSGAWVAVLAGGLLALLYDLGPLASTTLTVGLATGAGLGLAVLAPVRSIPEPLAEVLLSQLVPGSLAVGAVPWISHMVTQIAV